MSGLTNRIRQKEGELPLTLPQVNNGAVAGHSGSEEPVWTTTVGRGHREDVRADGACAGAELLEALHSLLGPRDVGSACPPCAGRHQSLQRSF